MQSFVERSWRFLAQPKAHRRLAICFSSGIAGALDDPDMLFPLKNVSGPDGHLYEQLSISPERMGRILDQAGSRILEFWAVESNTVTKFSGRIHLLRSEGISVVSDVDDTMKISDVPHKAQLMRNTFFMDFKATPGMPGLFSRLEVDHSFDDISFHYVSASPWQLFPPLYDFIENYVGYPPGMYYMKTFQTNTLSAFSLAMDPFKYKLEILRPLLESLPLRKFILIGDSGEKDPETYTHLYSLFPDRILHIYIRDVFGDLPNAQERLAKCFASMPEDRYTILDCDNLPSWFGSYE